MKSELDKKLDTQDVESLVKNISNSTIASRLKRKKKTKERTRGPVKSARLGLYKQPNTIKNGGKINE